MLALYRGERVAELDQQHFHPHRGGNDLPAGIGEAQAPSGAVEERQADIAFQQLDAGGERGGRDLQLVGGGCDSPTLGDRTDSLKLL